MTVRLPTFLVLTGSRELTVKMEPDEWIDPERALGLLGVMLDPTISRYLHTPLSSRTVDSLSYDLQSKLQDLVHKGVIWQRWGAFGIGTDVTVRIGPRPRGTA